MDLKIIGHRITFAAGIGLAAFAATGLLAASAVTTASAPFAGLYLFRFNNPAAFAVTYAPWVLLAFMRLARAPDARGRARAAIVLAIAVSVLLLGSTPKEGLAMLGALSVVGGLLIVIESGSWRERGGRLGWALVAGIGSLLLTAPHWLVFLHTLKESITAISRPYALAGGPAHAAALFVGPLTHGSLLPGIDVLALVTVIAALSAPVRTGPAARGVCVRGRCRRAHGDSVWRRPRTMADQDSSRRQHRPHRRRVPDDRAADDAHRERGRRGRAVVRRTLEAGVDRRAGPRSPDGGS